MMELKELCRAIADEKQLQYMPVGGEWRNVSRGGAIDYWSQANNTHLRIAPTLKPVDMSVLKDSGIDCEFWAGEMDRDNLGLPLIDNPAIGALTGISGNQYWRFSRAYFNNCRPRQDYWHSLRNCRAAEHGSNAFRQALENAGFRVIHSEECDAIKLELGENRCWPWEAV